MFTPRTLMILIPLLPLLAAIITALLGAFNIERKNSHLPVIAGCIGSFICSVLLASHVYSQVNPPVPNPEDPLAVAAAAELAASKGDSVGYEHVETLWTWANIKDAHEANEEIFATGPGGKISRDFKIDVSLRADPLTCIMLMLSLIHISEPRDS